MPLSNRKIVEEILPNSFARVIYQGREGVIASAPAMNSVETFDDTNRYIDARVISPDSNAEFSEDGPTTIYLPFKDDPEYSLVKLYDSGNCESGDKFQDLVTAACLSSPATAMYLLEHGGLLTENYPKGAYDDPAFCKCAVQIYGPRIQCVPLKNLTAELYMQAFSEGEEFNDLEEGNIPVLPLANPKLARELFSHELSGDAMEGLKEAFARHAPVFAEAARTTDWAEVVPAELWESTTAIRAAVRKLG